MADQLEPVVRNAHVEVLTAFLTKFRYNAITDVHIENGISKTRRLLDERDPFADKSGSSRSRLKTARQNLSSIKKEFGDAVYYLCLVVLGLTPLSTYITGGTRMALANWPDRHNIPPELIEKVKRAVKTHLPETQDGCTSSTVIFSPKRHREVFDKDNQGTTDDHRRAPKRSRTRYGSDLDVMSIAEITKGNKQTEGSQRSPGASATREDIESDTSPQSLFINQHSRRGTGDYQLPHTEPQVIPPSRVNTQGVVSHGAIAENDGDESDDSNDHDEDEVNCPPGYPPMSEAEHLPMVQDSRLPMPPMQQYGMQQYAFPPEFNLFHIDKSYGHQGLDKSRGPVNLIMPIYSGSEPTISYSIPLQFALDFLEKRRDIIQGYLP